MTVPREIARRQAWNESERECATCYTAPSPAVTLSLFLPTPQRSHVTSEPSSAMRRGVGKGGVNEHKVESSGSFDAS